jgi:hypothetical protein
MLIIELLLVVLGGLMFARSAVLLLLPWKSLCPSCQQLQCLPIASQSLGLVTRRVWVHRAVLVVLTSRIFFCHVVRRDRTFVNVVYTRSFSASARFPPMLHDRAR